MVATAEKYRSPYVSEILRETDGSLNDCAVCVTIMLVGDWTLGEALTNPDGSPKNVLFLREWVRRQLGPGAQDGGLTLHDANDMAHLLDPDLPDLPRYSGQRSRTGQSTAGAGLSLTFEAFRDAIRAGSSAALCGNPSGVKDPNSPLRSVQGNDDYAHVIHVTDGSATGALVKDPLTRHKPGWAGVRVSWDDLRQFTETKKNGQRLFGSVGAIACAVIKVGDQTAAARASRQSLATIARLNQKVADQKAQTALAADERDQAKRDLATANARIAELEAEPQADCTVAVNAERARVLDTLTNQFDEFVAGLR